MFWRKKLHIVRVICGGKSKLEFTDCWKAWREKTQKQTEDNRVRRLPKFLKKEVAYYTCYLWRKSKLEKNFVVGKWCRRYRTKRQQEHLLFLLTKRDTKFLQASKEIAEGELHSEDLPEHKNATRTEKCPIQNEQIENRALESFPRECSNVAFPTLKRGVFHDVTRCKGLGFRV